MKKSCVLYVLMCGFFVNSNSMNYCFDESIQETYDRLLPSIQANVDCPLIPTHTLLKLLGYAAADENGQTFEEYRDNLGMCERWVESNLTLRFCTAENVQFLNYITP